MSTAVVDWDKLQDSVPSLEPPSPGVYTAMCVDTEIKVAKSGNQMIVNRYTITEGPEKGKNFWDNIVFIPDNPGALAFFFRKLDAFGIKPSGKATLESLAAKMVDRVVQVVLKHREWEGRTQVDVDSYQQVQSNNGQDSGIPKLNWT